MHKHAIAVMWFLGALLPGSSAYAQTPARGWFVDANYVNAQSNQDEQRYETAAQSSTGGFLGIEQAYPEMPRAHGFEIGGGYTFGAGVGGGVRWLRTEYEYPIATGLVVVEPISIGLITIDSAVSDDVRRTETAVDLMATYTLPIPHPAVQVRAFGGPTYFNVKQAMVRAVPFTPTMGNISGTPIVTGISIDSVETADADGSGWGYNIGGDVAYFFSRHVGVGGGLRYSQGTVDEVPIPVENAVGGDREAEFDTGYFTIAVGLRFRF